MLTHSAPPLLFLMLCGSIALSVVAAKPVVDELEGTGLSPQPFADPGSQDWTWVAVNGTRCMDGEETGVYIKAGARGWSHSKLAVYFMGGGACFNFFTCATATNEAQPDAPGTGGEFDCTDGRNPYGEYNWIWIPYCTGDVHAGSAYYSEFEGQARYFQGRQNLQLIMQRAKATWATLDVVAVTGESAGGFGAAINFDFIRGTWGTAAAMGIMIDDSGPIPDNEAVAVCLQQSWMVDWSLNKTLPADCPCMSDDGNLWLGWKFFADRWPNDSIGLISSVGDATISSFFSFGNFDCESPIPTYYDKLAGGLDRLASNNVYNVSIYMIPGDVHTHTGDKPSFYTKTVNGIPMYKWIGELLAGNNPGTVWVK